MFYISQVCIATAHAHNIFLLYLGRYKMVKNQLFTNGSYRSVPKSVDFGGKWHPMVDNLPLSLPIFLLNFPLSTDALTLVITIARRLPTP